ncbi:Nn.00g007490.m01.CDS01 [Neocucurbitaria sp. VM-36]
MDAGSQDQDQVEPHGQWYVDYTGYPFHEYVPTPIEPCSPLTNGLASRSYHMLNCGHIIVVDENDGRCGRNCQRVADWALAVSANADGILNGTNTVIFEGPVPAMDILPQVSDTQLHDTLYCEVCSGIPFERYITMHPPEDPFNLMANTPDRLRRCFALTRELLKSTADLDDEHMDSLLCRPFFNPGHEAFDWKNTHFLRCGHEVCEEGE